MLWLGAQRLPADAMRGEPLIRVFADPFVLTVAGPVALLSGLLAFLLAVLWLRDTVLWKSATLITAAVLLEIVAVGSQDPVSAWVLSYPVLVAATLASRWLYGEPERAIA